MNNAFHEEEDIGSRLARVRTSHDLSQRQLAKLSGVAKATISQIETGNLNPTVGTLRKILGGLPMSLSLFFEDKVNSGEEQIYFSKQDLTALSDGNVSYLQVGKNLGGKSIQFMWECYASGGDTGRHALSHEGEECGFVISGELTVNVAGRERVLRAGEAYYFKSDKPHIFKNNGPVPCELVTACTPPTF